MTDSSTPGSSTSSTVVAILMGVSGVGKTTVGQAVARRLDWEFFDADDFHTEENVDKMSRGIPLTDDDRAGWLEVLSAMIARLIREGRPAVLACSALKRRYRDRLLRDNEGAVVVYLSASHDVVEERIRARPGHYFDARLLDSQYADLEEPAKDVAVDAAKPFRMVVDAVVERLAPYASAADGS